MTREELEAEMRRALTQRDRARDALADQHGTRDNVLVETVLRAADAYAAATVGEFAAPQPRAIHLAAGERAGLGTACNQNWIYGCSPAEAMVTAIPAAVTCGLCKRTGAYRHAAGTAAAS